MNTDEVKKLYTKKASLYHYFFIDFLGLGRKLKRFFLASNYLRPHLKILDAGCGTGVVTRILYAIMREKKYEKIIFHAFDFTPAMLNVFHKWIANESAKNITLKQADVLDLKNLPSNWKEYDLIVSEGMLEYLPKDKIPQALNDLKQLLKEGGQLLVFITRRNIVTTLLIERWWKANIYEEKEIEQIFQRVGFSEFRFKGFSTMWLNSTIVIEAKR